MKFQLITLNLNRRCNLRCRYCFFSDDIKHDPYEMDASLILDTVRFLKRTLKPGGRISFFGVEPLVSWDTLKTFVELTKPMGLKYNVTTNCLGLTEERIDWMFRHGFTILSSYDGSWHDRYRVLPGGRGSSSMVERSLDLLRSRGYRPLILMSMVPGEEKEFFRSIVSTYYRFKPGMLAMNKIVDSYPVEYDWPEVRRQFKLLAQWYKDDIDDVGKKSFTLQFISKTIQTMWPRSKRTRFTCGAAQGSISVDCDGRVFPCYKLFPWPEYQIGDVWNGVDAEKVEWWRNIRIPACHACDVHPCSVCYGENKLVTGELTNPNPAHCMWERIRMETCQEVFGWRPKM